MRRRYSNVTSFRDRHGKLRWRFRKAGLPVHYFLNAYGTPEFLHEWKGCLDGTTQSSNLRARSRPDLPDTSGKTVVYFVGAEDGPIKIGFSSNLPNRITEIQCGNPAPVRLLAFARGGQKTEARYHRRFFRHRLHGEWFSRAPEIVREMDRLRTLNGYPIEERVANLV